MTAKHRHSETWLFALPKSDCFQAANFGGLIPTESWSFSSENDRREAKDHVKLPIQSTREMPSQSEFARCTEYDARKQGANRIRPAG